MKINTLPQEFIDAQPVLKTLENAGFEGSVIVNKLKEQVEGFGYNAATNEWVDMIAAGIVDPTKVTRSALQNAASVSALLLTTEAVVAELPSDDSVPAMPQGGMPGMM